MALEVGSAPARPGSAALEALTESVRERSTDLVPVMVGLPPKGAILGLGYVGLPTALDRVDLSPLDHARLTNAPRGRRSSLSRRSMDLAGASYGARRGSR